MKLSTAKDKVLKSLVLNTPPFKELKIDKYTIGAAIESLAEGKFIATIESSTIGTGKVRTYEPTFVYPKGAHFVTSKQSFRTKAIWEWIAELPKKYWFIPIILAASGLTIKEIVEYFLQ